MKKATKSDIDLHVAITTMVGNLREFCAYWEEARRKDPDNYPDQPTMADWEEQFQAWRELRLEAEGA